MSDSERHCTKNNPTKGDEGRHEIFLFALKGNINQTSISLFSLSVYVP
jgi:hypothetical protein